MGARRFDARALVVGASGALLAWQIWDRRFLADDAFISFRYASHWADGLGLVWNAGERVEGYTNFAWVIVIGLSMRVGIEPERASLVLGAASAVLLWWLAYREAERSLRGAWALVVAVGLAASRSFGTWASGGLETMPYALVVFLAVRAYARAPERGVPWASAGWLALATLTRPDGVLFAVAIGACLLGTTLRARRPLGPLFAWSAAYLAPVLAHLAFRLAYYGAWLPNTFHAKVAGAWWSQGTAYLGLFASHYWAALWLVPALFAWRAPRPSWVAPCSIGVALYVGYLAYVGGDLYEFRLLVPLLPLAWLFVARGGEVLWHDVRGGAWARAAAALLVAGSLVGAARSSWAPAAQVFRAGIFGTPIVEDYTAQRVRDGTRLRSMIDAGRLPADFVLAVGAAGAVPYYSRLPALDFYGLSDAHVARQPVSARAQVGHEKRATNAYMHERGVEGFDILNRLVIPKTSLAEARAIAADALARHHVVDPGPPVFRFVCRDIGNSYVFVFASARTPNELDARLPHMPACERP